MSVESRYRLINGQVYDPRNGLAGEVREVWIADGLICAPPPPADAASFQAIDVGGRVIMPGGIDMHSHIVGPKVNAARELQPELFVGDYLDRPDHLRGRKILPPLTDAASQYLAMGYTTVFDAAISPLASRQVLGELEHFPGVDAGFFALVGNNHFLMQAAAQRDVPRAARFLEWLLARSQAYAPKVVNPGGVELWKSGRPGDVRDLDLPVTGFNTTPRQILSTLAAASHELQLPHPLHVHCNNLGMPGNWETTLATLQTLAGLRCHLTHIQFHSYGGNHPENLSSQVEPLAAFINDHPEISIDVGQVLFGETTSMTGDGPLGHFLSELSGKKWYSSATELESGCGISPIEYRNRSLLNAWQWHIGLEWFLKVRNPWQIALTTDHPNGASFLAYPRIIRLLMDREFRRSEWERLPDAVRALSDLPHLTREYSLEEICIITRAAPARLLGLRQQGHMGAGALADLTIYTRDANFELMFQSPWMVIKGGEIILQDHQLCRWGQPRTWVARSHVNPDSDAEFSLWVANHYSVAGENWGVRPDSDFFSRPRHSAD